MKKFLVLSLVCATLIVISCKKNEAQEVTPDQMQDTTQVEVVTPDTTVADTTATTPAV